jgi:hypothetical protein
MRYQAPVNRTSLGSRLPLLLSVLLVCYIGSHFVISRTSAHLVKTYWGINDFFIYLPIDPNFVDGHEVPCSTIHNLLRVIYAPVWFADSQVFGGPRPLYSMPLFRIDTSAPSVVRNQETSN